MALPIQFPVFVRLKDCGDVISFSSIVSMRRTFERTDVENEEYQAWDANAHPLKMFVKQTPDWLGLEVTGVPQAEQLRNAIKGFAQMQDVQLTDSFEQTADFSQLLEMIASAISMKRQNDSWWQKLKKRF